MAWLPYALGSAVFAGLTAIFGKVGVADVNSDLATLLRTVIILAMTAAIVTARGEWEAPGRLPARSVLFLALSAAATGLSWLCYYRALQLGPASKVAPVDKLSAAFAIALAMVFLRERPTAATLIGGGLVVLGSIVLAIG